MNVMVKINRALKKAKLSVVEINQGEQKVAEKNFNFLCDGKQVPVTLRAVSLERDNQTQDRVELVVWESVRRVSGKCIDIAKGMEIIPGFDQSHPLFASEVEKLRKKTESSKRLILISSGPGRSNYSEIYPDE